VKQVPSDAQLYPSRRSSLKPETVQACPLVEGRPQLHNLNMQQTEVGKCKRNKGQVENVLFFGTSDVGSERASTHTLQRSAS
jgi:hypothetical protein